MPNKYTQKSRRSMAAPSSGSTTDEAVFFDNPMTLVSGCGCDALKCCFICAIPCFNGGGRVPLRRRARGYTCPLEIPRVMALRQLENSRRFATVRAPNVLPQHCSSIVRIERVLSVARPSPCGSGMCLRTP
jgi:hypothetical protein